MLALVVYRTYISKLENNPFRMSALDCCPQAIVDYLELLIINIHL